ncbi:hypothetical protein CLOSTMETH_03369 [[Clostridium] methylpentosum DSM 5476]|uniref:Uncharacterized protein n=1 Tax=[Clostridium] methylpentosum DSM 5476 TaxID=537013 RepID=C0EHM4_9FIRM|nr:hypothetical protein CLOSTMETH_03369 [[Clostridium] methylpentosum DSM 5476]MDY3988730.1 DUF6483 family protein [Massilioclostridium sp.]MEE1491355.1 DUF6483 family protein [Massilioclostridium sp.]
MLRDDFILDQIDMIERFLQTVLFESPDELSGGIDNIRFFDDQELIRSDLQRKIENHRYNEAEDFLFEEIEKDPKNDEMYKLGMWFYHKLAQIDEDTLEEHNFSKDEVLEGLQEIERMRVGN